MNQFLSNKIIAGIVALTLLVGVGVGVLISSGDRSTTTTSTTSTTSTTIPKICATGGTCSVGDTGPGGGKVFYDAGSTQSWGRYLEVAPTDYQVNGSPRVAWGCYGTITGATATAIGTGKANTATILATCKETDIAADVAYKYSTTTTPNAPGAAGQWFLPSKDELNELCKIYSNGSTDTAQYESNQNGCTGSTSPTGGFAADNYWSSSEIWSGGAWYQYFNYGYQGNDAAKYYATGFVRPVRAF